MKPKTNNDMEANKIGGTIIHRTQGDNKFSIEIHGVAPKLEQDKIYEKVHKVIEKYGVKKYWSTNNRQQNDNNMC